MRSRSGFDYLCTHYPSLNDVWASHLIPYIVLSKSEVESKRFLVACTLYIIYRRARIWLPSNPIWTACRPWYIQPDVLIWNPRVFGIEHVSQSVVWHINRETYSVNMSICCCMQLTSSGRAYKTRDVLPCADSDLVYWTLYNDGVVYYADNRQLATGEPQLSEFCPHVHHHMVMHAIRHVNLEYGID
jgi:hypothetical protein